MGILHPAIYRVAYFLCQLQLPHHSSSLPTITTSFLPHWNSAWHTDTAHSWHKAQRGRERERKREREKHTRTCTNRLVPPPLCLCQAFIPSRGPRDQGNPIGISLPLLPAKICSNSEEFCWHPTALCVCVFGDLLINLRVYVVCVGWGVNPMSPAFFHSGGEGAKAYCFHDIFQNNFLHGFLFVKAGWTSLFFLCKLKAQQI